MKYRNSGDYGNIRVGASISHGEQTRFFVLQLKVLVGKLVAIDGLATSALFKT
jgi:hypothetical protein